MRNIYAQNTLRGA